MQNRYKPQAYEWLTQHFPSFFPAPNLASQRIFKHDYYDIEKKRAEDIEQKLIPIIDGWITEECKDAELKNFRKFCYKKELCKQLLGDTLTAGAQQVGWGLTDFPNSVFERDMKEIREAAEEIVDIHEPLLRKRR